MRLHGYEAENIFIFYINSKLYTRNKRFNCTKIMIYSTAGNKIDRDDREIPTDVGEEFAQRHGMVFLETSAKACDNVEKLFNEIASELLQVIISIIDREASYFF